MNARTQKKTTTEQTKPKIYSSVPTVVDDSRPKEKKTEPQKLRSNSKIVVGKPKEGAHTRRPRNATHVSYPKEGRNNLQRIALKPTNKTQIPRPIKSTSMGPRVSGPRGNQLTLKSSPAIPGRQASTAFVGPSPAFDIQGRLKKKSPWFSSMMNPVQNAGVKIPDPVGTDTATYQHVENVSVSVGANGIAGLRVITPYINNYHYGAADDDGSNYQTTSTTLSSVANLYWGSPAVPGQGALPFARVPAMMKANAQSHRIVSACVIAQPEVSTLSDAGEMCAFVKPFDCNDSNVNYSTIQSQWDSSLMPVNQHKPMIARWYPVSSDYEIFNTIESYVQDEPPTISYQDFIDPDVHFEGGPDADQGVIPFEFGVVCTGMTPSTGVVRFQICVNYEYIPKTQTTMVDSSPSPVDPTEEQLVCSWVSDCPVTGPVSQKQASAPPASSTVSERNEPTGFGMFFNVLQELTPLVKAFL